MYNDGIMTGDKRKGTPLTGPSFYGNRYQRRCIERWQDAGWAFLHWTEIPQVMAVLENLLGDVIFIDENGWAWKGPTFSKSKLVPFNKYPPLKSSEGTEN
jgi:hypothetical protein